MYALTRRRWNFVSLIVGVFHMLFAATLSFAPFRSWFDPSYLGLGLGFLRFEGRKATLPCAVMLAWATPHIKFLLVLQVISDLRVIGQLSGGILSL
jgi:hypothetical protein